MPLRNESKPPRRIIVCGGRKYRESGRITNVLGEYLHQAASYTQTVIHGMAPGADMIADREARELGYAVERHPARWDDHGKAAGPLRNQAMVDAGADLLIAFGGGKGTSDCVRRARKADIPVRWEDAPLGEALDWLNPPPELAPPHSQGALYQGRDGKLPGD